MEIGLSTYALFWEISNRVPNPLSIEGMIRRTADLGCNVLQICDYSPLEFLDDGGLKRIRAYATELNIAIELGTRGTEPQKLTRYLELAEMLDAHVLRSMVQTGSDKPSFEENIRTLESLGHQLETQDVKLALETYEQLPTAQLVDLIKTVDNPRIGIALDPANCVANLENPHDVISRCAPFTLNLHVKDFAFARQTGWVGFTYSGVPLGEGLLDYEYEIQQVKPTERGVSQIVEHWLSWQGDPKKTIAEEQRWTKIAINYIRSRSND
jgi:sugar phosphate isomerase/epimerase